MLRQAMAVLGLTFLASCSSDPKPDPGDGDPTPQYSRPPQLVIGQGVGLSPVAEGTFRLEANVGQPLVKPVANPGSLKLSPGLLPQTQVP